MSTLETFRCVVPPPVTPHWLNHVETYLLQDGRLPIRWALVEITPEGWIIEGTRWCSPSSI